MSVDKDARIDELEKSLEALAISVEAESPLWAAAARSIARKRAPGETPGCPFCERIHGGLYAPTDIAGVVCFEPLNPVTPGHLLFVPEEHGGGNFKENPHETAEAVRAAALHARISVAEDCNIIVSSGANATQTVQHVHVHLVPRRPNDGLKLPWTDQQSDRIIDGLDEVDAIALARTRRHRIQDLEREKSELQRDLIAATSALAVHEREVARLHTAQEHLEEVRRLSARRRDERDNAYTERNRLIAALSKLFPSHVYRDPGGEPGYTLVVSINLPTGQATWHIPFSEESFFAHLPTVSASDWDGHTTEQKYRRLELLPVNLEVRSKPVFAKPLEPTE